MKTLPIYVAALWLAWASAAQTEDNDLDSAPEVKTGAYLVENYEKGGGPRDFSLTYALGVTRGLDLILNGEVLCIPEDQLSEAGQKVIYTIGADEELKSIHVDVAILMALERLWGCEE